MTPTPTPIPSAAVAAPQPTSRATFRHLVKALGATNREADALRHDLLGRLAGSEADLVRELRAIDADDPAGARGAEIRLAAWFAHATATSAADASEAAESGARLAEGWAEASNASPVAMGEVARLVRLHGAPSVPDEDARPEAPGCGASASRE